MLLAAPIHTKHTSLCWDGGKMIRNFRCIAWSALSLIFVFCAALLKAQLGNSGSIEGVVKDPSGSSVPGAKVEVSNPVSGFHRETTTDTDGAFRFTNVPFNPYHLVVTATGFNSYTPDVDTSLIDRLPLESQSSAASSLVTLASPGVVADSNGLFHGLGDHAENSFSVDGQPIT